MYMMSLLNWYTAFVLVGHVYLKGVSLIQLLGENGENVK